MSRCINFSFFQLFAFNLIFDVQLFIKIGKHPSIWQNIKMSSHWRIARFTPVTVWRLFIYSMWNEAAVKTTAHSQSAWHFISLYYFIIKKRWRLYGAHFLSFRIWIKKTTTKTHTNTNTPNCQVSIICEIHWKVNTHNVVTMLHTKCCVWMG